MCAGTPSAALPTSCRRSRSRPEGRARRTMTAGRQRARPAGGVGRQPPVLRLASRASTSASSSSAVERGELLVERGRGDLLHAPDLRLLAPDPLLEAVELARRIHDRGALQACLDLALRLGHLRPADQLVALLDELLAPGAELVQAVLELLGELGLARRPGVSSVLAWLS